MASTDQGEPLVAHHQRLWLYLLGGLVLFFLVLPVFIVIPMSFSGTRFLDFPPRVWSLRWYSQYAASVDWREATWVSLRAAVATTLLATPIGVAAAYAIHVSEWPLLRRLQTYLLLPLMVPHIIAAIGILYVYAAFKINGTLGGLILAHTMVALPFVVVTSLSGLRSYDMNLEKVARSLGHSRFSAFMRVTLPLILPNVISGALFAFITSLDEVIIAIFITSGTNSTLTKIMFTSLRDELDPTIAAISSLLIVFSLSVVAAAALTSGLSRRRNRS